MAINLLEPKIFNRIAAGEVVERPASIVKELVENSIDAGATEITIEIENGGIKKIAISDNGCGIEKEDIEKAFLPHATSKIKSIEDLDSIGTLGFRGEALSSIASVCHVTMSTKVEHSEVGYMLSVSLGEFSNITEIARSKGTTITASDLFYNIPARAKFLKKPKFEETEITHLIEKFMLAHSEIAFKYYVDGMQVYNTSSCRLSDIIYTIYGREVYENLLEVNYESGGIRVEGYVASPKVTKSNRTYQTLFVNSRYVENYFVSACVQTVYEPFLMKGKFPLYVLNLVVPFEDVDVNVHPNKKEVKFEDQRKMFVIIKNAIEEALATANKITTFKADFVNEEKDEEKTVSNEKIDLSNIVPITIDEGQSFKSKIEPKEENNNRSLFEDTIIEEIKIPDFSNITTKNSSSTLIFDQNNTSKAVQVIEECRREKEIKEDKFISASVKDEMKILAVLFNTYIIVEYQDSAYVIDQHAAHERLLYDKLKLEIDSNNVIKQDLLIPYEFNVQNKEIEIIDENLDNLASIGFDIEGDGKGNYKILSVPSIISSLNLADFIEFILSDCINWNVKASNIIKEKLCQTACKHAIKGGDVLSEDSVAYLVDNMRKGIMQCPHGRPSIVELSKKEIEKMFKRII